MPGRTWVTGPDIELTLDNPSTQAAPERLSGIIDTGASVICLDSRVTSRLGLVASNRKRMQMADGKEVMATGYRARMKIPVLEFDDWVEVFAVDMDYPSTRVLLGRSFLKSYMVTYDGPRELFEFHKAEPESYLSPEEQYY